MEKKPTNFQDIHIEDYLSEYEALKTTWESFIFAEGRKKQSLNGTWTYAVDQYDTCVRQKWFLENYKDQQGLSLPVDFSFDQWPKINLPCCWNTFSKEYLLYEGSMIFNKKFKIENHCAGSKIFLKIGAANYTTRVFLNKKYIGLHRGGSTPFFYDITDLIQEENRLIIAVDNTRRPEQVPTENTDWFNYGGLYRDIELIFTPETFIKDFKISLVPDNQYNKIQTQIDISSSNSKIEKIQLSIPELGINKEVLVNQNNNQINHIDESFEIENLNLWSPENPKLYDVELSLLDNENKIIDSVCDSVGFRQIAVDKNQIYLNGKPIFLKGISCHEDSVKNGKALTDKERIENIKIAKKLGCNFMRLAHYPHNENMAKLADKMGLLLWEEIPVYWAIKFTRFQTYQDAENQLKELILRDFNRASVIIWSVGNENVDTDDRLAFMSNLAQTAHEIDSTRLVSAACLVNNEKNMICDRLANYLDVIGLNEYMGWYDPDFNKLPELLSNSNPDKPVIITEFGADALPKLHGPATEKGNEEFQEWVYEQQTQTLEKIPYISGMTPWILYDFRCPRRSSYIQKYYNRKGLLSPDKKHYKKAFFVLQKFYKTTKR